MVADEIDAAKKQNQQKDVPEGAEDERTPQHPIHGWVFRRGKSPLFCPQMGKEGGKVGVKQGSAPEEGEGIIA